ncbi:hypothetical protein [Streptococcus equi]|uniref:Peptidase n=1 Tax=Streptococcus equi subsp. equi TaxID=148942 RepID=A0A380JR85_9STRE|nr:hypothetical protein [Streptococcus equi]SUN46813.1 peptidase [Streptococcus equi subsp. equi]
MKYINSSLKPVDNFYSLEEVTCFDRLLGIFLNSINNSYCDLFYMVNNFYRCYRSNDNSNKYDFEREILILKDIFCIKSEKINFSDEVDLAELIVRCVDKYGFVFTPINLKSIYYSTYYREKNWPHLFLINGYDKEKELFYIVDSTQIYSDTLTEHNFCITFEMLKYAYKSYFNEYLLNKEREYILIISSTVNKASEVEVFQKAFHHMFNQSDVLSREFEIINSILISRDFNLLMNLKNVAKKKKLFFAILFEKLQLYGLISKKELADLFQTLDIVLDKWTIFINRWIKDILKNNNQLLNTDFFVPEEKKLFEFFSKQVSIYQEKLVESIALNFNTDSEIFKCLQNSEQIITIIAENPYKFRFNFTGDKVYNSWFNDDSPKVRINKCLNQFGVKINVVYNEKDSKFVAGIYCFINDNLYYFGLDSSCFINLDLMGKNPRIFRKRLETSEVYLKIVRHEDSCEFSYSVDGITYFYATSLDIRSCHFSCGIGCKTYSKPMPLCIDFDDIFIG